MDGFTDELVGLDIAHKREMREFHRQAQGLVDQQDAQIIYLKRKLANTQRDLASSQRSNAAIIEERGIARNARMMRRFRLGH